MANKRNLKRGIHMVCEELFTEAVAISLYGPSHLKNNAEAIFSSIVLTERNYISRVSHPEPGMKPKDYYRDLREKFAAQVGDFINQLNG
jgi:hypothetical protein